MSVEAMPGEIDRPRWRVPILLTLIIALAACLRWHGITARGFFFDELWITEVASGYGSDHYLIPVDQFVDQPNLVSLSHARPVWQVPGEATGVIHPPGTFVVLRLWRDLFGDSMLALRSGSAAWSTVVVVLLFVVTKRSFGTRAGLWAALLSAIALGNVDQAQDVRGYTMLQAFLLLTAIALIRLRGRSSDWLGASLVGLGTLAMMYTHYFAAGVCIAMGIGAITLLRGPVRWQTLSAMAIAGGVWIVTWLPHLREQLAFIPETADIFLLDPSQSPLLATLLRSIASPYQSLVADPRPEHGILLIGGGIVCVLLGYRFVQRGSDVSLTRFWFIVLLGAFGVLLTIDLARQSKHLEFPKYLQLMNPALCVLLGSLAIARRAWLLPALVSVGLATAFILTPFSAKPDLRPQLAWLQQRAAPNDLFILPAQQARGREGQTRYLSIAHALPWPRHRIAIPVGPQSQAWIDALPRDGKWFCLTFAAYDPETWQTGLEIVDRGPVASGVAVYEVRHKQRS